MSSSSTKDDITFLNEFKAILIDYFNSRLRLENFKNSARDNYEYFDGYTGNATPKYQEEAMRLAAPYSAARERLAKNITRADALADKYEAPSVIRVQLPMLEGGGSFNVGIFQALLEPLNLEGALTPQRIFDLISQMIGNAERAQDVEVTSALNPPGTIAKFPKAVAKGFNFFFNTDTDKSVIKWLVIVLLGGLILRFVFGLPLEKIGQMIIKAIEKHI
jgi:hypothetical protein